MSKLVSTATALLFCASLGAIASAASDTGIYSFGGKPNGAYPLAGLINVGKTLYGTTDEGGVDNLGTVFSISPTGVEKVLHSFTGPIQGGSDGALPEAPLITVGNARYGTTYLGGAYGAGTVFEISSQGEKVIYSFGGYSDDGRAPITGLTYVKGLLYGTTKFGGSDSGGTVFQLTLGGTETIIHSFGDCARSLADGCYPGGRLLSVGDKLFGTTAEGGILGYGIVYELIGTSEYILYSFAGGADGGVPDGGLISVNGVLYGVTDLGGESPTGQVLNDGIIYSVTVSGSEKIVHTFCVTGANGLSSDGCGPSGELLDVGGTLYGSTSGGGNMGSGGTAYAIQPSGQGESILHNFGSPFDASNPTGTLILVDGLLYGMTEHGSFVPDAGYGTVYSLAP